MNQETFIKRLEARSKELRSWNCDIHDITCLYSDFTTKTKSRYNYIWRENIRPFLKQFKKRKDKKGVFNRKLFALAIFNNLYSVRQIKDDSIPYGCKEDSSLYKFLASHQYVRRVLEYMPIDDIIYLSYALAKTFR